MNLQTRIWIELVVKIKEFRRYYSVFLGLFSVLYAMTFSEATLVLCLFILAVEKRCFENELVLTNRISINIIVPVRLLLL